MGILKTYNEIADSVYDDLNNPKPPFRLHQDEGQFQVTYTHSDTDEVITMGDDSAWYDESDAQELANLLNLAYALGSHDGSNDAYCG